MPPEEFVEPGVVPQGVEVIGIEGYGPLIGSQGFVDTPHRPANDCDPHLGLRIGNRPSGAASYPHGSGVNDNATLLFTEDLIGL